MNERAVGLNEVNLVTLLALAVRKGIHEIGGQDKLDTLALHSQLGLPVAEEVSEINMEKLQCIRKKGNLAFSDSYG